MKSAQAPEIAEHLDKEISSTDLTAQGVFVEISIEASLPAVSEVYPQAD